MITSERFVKVWQLATSLEEVSRQTKLPIVYCDSRASTLRKNGVPLKRFKAKPRDGKLDFNALAALASSLAPTGIANGHDEQSF